MRILGLCGTAGIPCGWALLGYSVVGHCRDTLQLGAAGMFCGYSAVGQGYSAVEHARRDTEGAENIDFLKSNNPTMRVGNKSW